MREEHESNLELKKHNASLLNRCLELTKIQTGGHLLIEGNAFGPIMGMMMQHGFVGAGTDFSHNEEYENVAVMSNDKDVFVRLINIKEPTDMVSVEVIHYRDIQSNCLLTNRVLDQYYKMSGSIEYIRAH